MTYRAAYYVAPDGQGEILLTGPEHADWTDAEIIAEAVAEAYRADILSDSLTEADLRSGIQIGEWDEGQSYGTWVAPPDGLRRA